MLFHLKGQKDSVFFYFLIADRIFCQIYVKLGGEFFFKAFDRVECDIMDFNRIA